MTYTPKSSPAEQLELIVSLIGHPTRKYLIDEIIAIGRGRFEIGLRSYVPPALWKQIMDVERKYVKKDISRQDSELLRQEGLAALAEEEANLNLSDASTRQPLAEFLESATNTKSVDELLASAPKKGK